MTLPSVGAARRPTTRYRTHGLGTVADLVVTDPGVMVAASRILDDEIRRMDRLASRFRDDSELAALHRSDGRPTTVTDDLLDAVQTALRVAEATDGAVDPTVGSAMVRLGYDRDFAQVAGGVGGRLPPARPVPGWRTVEVDVPSGTVRVPAGVVLDLGASAKALVADRVADRVRTACGCGVVASLGGDLAVAGAPPEGFSVGLGDDCRALDPMDPRDDETVAVRSGGLATSSLTVRRWTLGGTVVHHILDPRTGRPVPPVWRTVTVCAASCVDANAASTAAMVLGEAAVEWLGSRALPARLVTPDGRVVTVDPWPRATGAGDGP